MCCIQQPPWSSITHDAGAHRRPWSSSHPRDRLFPSLSFGSYTPHAHDYPRSHSTSLTHHLLIFYLSSHLCSPPLHRAHAHFGCTCALSRSMLHHLSAISILLHRSRFMHCFRIPLAYAPHSYCTSPASLPSICYHTRTVLCCTSVGLSRPGQGHAILSR
ncbi:hypothetical protein BD626DRAFT_520986 [Schizophyllum amplum]|uniref:Uncharacterized protein n=1 Tax=Schizophyllum amplum TaxID=97359 RepID=A0A550BU49_9AGAR|nr:hypothetical protein BD626DRAFT_520986 [Auriculariopsis ampla]